jgi:L-iditol 2-dehydrogenase
MEEAALIEPLAVCVRAMRRLRIERTGSALVLGDGVIGLLMLVLLKRAGVVGVAMVGGRAARLAAARELGACCVINYHDAGGELGSSVARLAGHPFPNVIEASGSPAALERALVAADRGGKVLVVGDYGDGRAGFAWNHLLHRELELIGSCASAGAWGEAVALASGGGVSLGRLISHRLMAPDYARGIELARNDRTSLKVLLDWREETR